MAWIKVEHNIATKIEVFQMAQMLQINRQEIVGHLVNFWVWADQNTEDGKILGNTDVIDILTIPDFGDALINVGWLNVIDQFIEIPKFLLHNGSSAKKRALTAQRVANHRKRHGSDDKVTDALLYKTILNKNKNESNNTVNEIKDLWNKFSKTKIKALTVKRIKQIKELQANHTIEEISSVFEKVAKIPFMQGKNDRNWIADFNYVLRPDKFLKILEGGWDSQITKQNDGDWTK